MVCAGPLPGPESIVIEVFPLKQITNYTSPPQRSLFPQVLLLVPTLPFLTQPSCSSKSELNLWIKSSSNGAAIFGDRLSVLVASLHSGASSPAEAGRRVH